MGDEFRADLGFLPQVGYREALTQYRRTFYPKSGFFRSVRGKLASRRAEDNDRNLLLQRVVPGIQFDGRFNSFGSFDYKFEKVRAGSQIFDRQYVEYYTEFSPGRKFGQISLEGFLGDDVDFVSAHFIGAPDVGFGVSQMLDREWIAASAGFSYKMNENFQAFLEASSDTGRGELSNTAVQAGFTFDF